MKQPFIRLYGMTPHDRSGKVRWLLTELGLEFEDRWISREKKEYESAEYLRINPMGRIPAIEIGDQILFESCAICAYLADRFAEGGLAPALDSRERAEYQKWMYFAAATVDSVQTRVMIIEDIPPGEIQKTKEMALQSDLRDICNTLDQALAKNSYLAGNRFSAADICVSYPLTECRLWPELETVIRDFPRVISYLERMKAMPSATKSKVFSFER